MTLLHGVLHQNRGAPSCLCLFLLQCISKLDLSSLCLHMQLQQIEYPGIHYHSGNQALFTEIRFGNFMLKYILVSFIKGLFLLNSTGHRNRPLLICCSLQVIGHWKSFAESASKCPHICLPIPSQCPQVLYVFILWIPYFQKTFDQI